MLSELSKVRSSNWEVSLVGTCTIQTDQSHVYVCAVVACVTAWAVPFRNCHPVDYFDYFKMAEVWWKPPWRCPC